MLRVESCTILLSYVESLGQASTLHFPVAMRPQDNKYHLTLLDSQQVQLKLLHLCKLSFVASGVRFHKITRRSKQQDFATRMRSSFGQQIWTFVPEEQILHVAKQLQANA